MQNHESNHTHTKTCECNGCKGNGTATCTCGCLDPKTAHLHEGHKHHHAHTDEDHHHHDHGASQHHEHSMDMHSHGHGHGHHGHHLKDYLVRFVISTIVSIPVIILSPMIQMWLGYSLTFLYSNYLILVLSTFIFVYGGIPFFKGAFAELKSKTPAMMSLVALAISVSYGYSVYTTFSASGMDFFWELATLIDIMLLGHYLEMKSSMVASSSLESLSKLLPSIAHLVHGEHVHDVELSLLKHQDIILIKPGEKVPADGIVINGESALDESMVTGESHPVLKTQSSSVIGGTINGDGVLTVQVTKLGDESYLSQVIKLVNESLASKSKTERLADVAAKYLFYVSIIAAIITALVWALVGESTDMVLERVVTVIVIACPHALGVAIPLVTSISTTLAAKSGLLIKNRSAFENGRKVNHVI